MPKLSDRVNTFTDSVIRRMTRISDEYGAINLSQGFPDFDPPKAILDRLAEVASEGPHQYSVTFGAENFREALAKKQGKAIGREINPETEIVVTCGGTEAMMSAMMTICNPGDKVMVFSPFYENYGADAILSGAEPIYIPLVPPTYEFDINLVEEGFKAGAKAIIVCNPSNPCGKVFTREELTQIGELAVKYDGFVVTDEVYEHMVYAPNEHVCMASLPGMYEHTITCNSLSKTYSITGWRLGYLIGHEEVIEGTRFPDGRRRRAAAGGCRGGAGISRILLQRPVGALYKEEGAFLKRSGCDRSEAQCAAGNVFCHDRYPGVPGSAAVCRIYRSGVLRVDDQKYRRGSRSGFQLFPGKCKQSDPSAFCTGGEDDRQGTGTFEEIKGVAVR